MLALLSLSSQPLKDCMIACPENEALREGISLFTVVVFKGFRTQ